MNGFSKVLAAAYSMLGPFHAYDPPQQIQGIPRSTRYVDPHYQAFANEPTEKCRRGDEDSQ